MIYNIDMNCGLSVTWISPKMTTNNFLRTRIFSIEEWNNIFFSLLLKDWHSNPSKITISYLHFFLFFFSCCHFPLPTNQLLEIYPLLNRLVIMPSITSSVFSHHDQRPSLISLCFYAGGLPPSICGRHLSMAPKMKTKILV